MSVVNLDRYRLARFMAAGTGMSPEEWQVLEDEICEAQCNSPEWKHHVREQRIYRGLQRARKRCL